MFTCKDIEARTVFVINCLEHTRFLRVCNGQLLLEEDAGEEGKKTLTKFPFQKVLALFVIGHISVTTPLIEKCKKHNVALIVVKPNLRPVFYWAEAAEGNYLLRMRQHLFGKDDLSVARWLVGCKINNQISCLKKTRRRDDLTLAALARCEAAMGVAPHAADANGLMGVEGTAARAFFAAYFQDMDWHGRKPRTKCDVLNATLDIGYTILFNFVECFLRMFGFDLYIGIYHRLWFKRKSLVCDLVEPFRCLIDHATLLAFHRKQFTEKDFKLTDGAYYLRREKCAHYYKVFCSALIEKKLDIFRFIQAYYRCFMGKKSIAVYPKFEI